MKNEQKTVGKETGGDVYRNGFARFWLKKRKQNLMMLLIVLLSVIFAGSVFVGVFIGRKLGMVDIDPNDGYNYSGASESYSAIYEEGDPNFVPIDDVTDAASLKDWLRKWATNGGEKMYSKDIINCLLCGIDSESGTMEGGRADAMILVSVNKRTKEVVLTSFLRDGYTYMDLRGDERYYKVNSVYNWGGPAALVETIENNYKIKIDNYICVDFKTFPKVIDALGGVTLEVQQYEARYINRTTRYNIDYGPAVTLSGHEALVFSRIRYSDIDGDISRTRRQRQIILSLIDKARGASAGQINNMLNLLLPFVRTNYNKTQILSYTTQAFVQDWLSYGMKQFVAPQLDADGVDRADVTGKSSNIYTGYGAAPEFVWIVDYQLDARRLQMELYGRTNIELHDDRTSPFDFMSRIAAVTTSPNNSNSVGSEPETESGTEYTDYEEPTEAEETNVRSFFDWLG